MVSEDMFKFLNQRVSKLKYYYNRHFENDSENRGIEIAPEFNLTYDKQKKML